MTITKFDNPTCRSFQAELLDYLAPFLESKGVTVEQSGMGKFDGASFKLPLEFKVKAAGDEFGRSARDISEIRSWMSLEGLKLPESGVPELKRYVILGYRTRAQKRPWELLDRARNVKVVAGTDFIRRELLLDKAGL